MSEVLKKPTSNAPHIDLAAALEPAALAVWLDHEYAAHTARTTELLAVYERFLVATKDGINDDTVTGRATDFTRQIKAAITDTDATRTRIKAPVLHAQRLIDGDAKKLTDKLNAASGVVMQRINVYLQAKAEAVRKAAEAEAQRLAAEADAAIAAADTGDAVAVDTAVAAIQEAQHAAAHATAALPDLTRTRSAGGGLAGLKSNWTYAVEDLSKVPAHLLQVNDSAVKLAIKQGARDVPGLRIFDDAKVFVR